MATCNRVCPLLMPPCRNKECPTCRKKLISKRSLRPDPNFDALIAKVILSFLCFAIFCNIIYCVELVLSL